MSFTFYKKIVSPYLLLLLLFIFTNQLIQSQTLISSNNLDKSLLPFGSQSGTFSTRCNINQFTTFTILNNCSYPLWPAAVPGGGRRLDTHQIWLLNLPSATTRGRIWGRTNCSFDNSGKGNCETGDCGGVLQCETYGSPPKTLAEYSLNVINNQDFLDISLVEGFNIAMEFRPVSNGCSRSRGVICDADIKGECPRELKAVGGCNNPCTVFKTTEYCCEDLKCGPTDYSKFFKERCPDAYSYPLDDSNSTFTCPSAGTSYDVVFCPS